MKLASVYAGLSFHKGKHSILSQGFWWDAFYAAMYGCIPYSHAYLRFIPPGATDYSVFHSTGVGSHFLPYDEFLVGRGAFEEYLIKVEKDKWDHFANRCKKLDGTIYPSGEIAGIMIANVLRFITFGKVDLRKNPFSRGESEMFCSETAQRLIAELVPQFEWTKDSDLISPFDFREGMLMMEQAGLATIVYRQSELVSMGMLSTYPKVGIREVHKRASRITL